MQAFNAPYSMVMLEIDSVGMFDTAVEALGKIFVTTELGGGGTVTARSGGIARRGARNFLIHAGILAGEIEREPTVNLDMPDGDCFVFAEHDGHDRAAGRSRRRGREGPGGRAHLAGERTGADAARLPGEARRNAGGAAFPGLVKPGDCLAVVAFVEYGAVATGSVALSYHRFPSLTSTGA